MLMYGLVVLFKENNMREMPDGFVPVGSVPSDEFLFQCEVCDEQGQVDVYFFPTAGTPVCTGNVKCDGKDMDLIGVKKNA